MFLRFGFAHSLEYFGLVKHENSSNHAYPVATHKR